MYENYKGRKYAYIICDDNSEFKVPYHKLSKISGVKKQRVQSQAEKLRLQFHVNDRSKSAVPADAATISNLPRRVILSPAKTTVGQVLPNDDGTTWSVNAAVGKSNT